MPYDNYPVAVEPGQVFVIDYTMADGSLDRMYCRADDGVQFQGKPATVKIIVD